VELWDSNNKREEGGSSRVGLFGCLIILTFTNSFNIYRRTLDSWGLASYLKLMERSLLQGIYIRDMVDMADPSIAHAFEVQMTNTSTRMYSQNHTFRMT
jgi:hypothetical protein